jgi:hypothetical protein
VARDEGVKTNLVEARDQLGDGIVGASASDRRGRLIGLPISNGE